MNYKILHLIKNYAFYAIASKRVSRATDGKRTTLPMDTCNSSVVPNALEDIFHLLSKLKYDYLLLANEKN